MSKLVGAALLIGLIAESNCSRHTPDVAVKDPTGEGFEMALPGVDTASLTPRERKEWSRYVAEFVSPCADVPVPVAQCLIEKRACKKCLPAAQFLLRSVRDGLAREQVEKAYKGRFDAATVREIAIDGSPTKGRDVAPVTIVEFADFECPYCGVMAPLLDKVFASRTDKIRVVYKFMPLSSHPHAEIAARAAIAAMGQGKFWEMHKLLYANQKKLEQSDLDGYAKAIGLDAARFRADMGSEATTARLNRDRVLADKLDVKATPSIYINGREWDSRQDLDEWIGLELGESKPHP